MRFAFALFALWICGISSPALAKPAQKIQIHGHRGARGVRPENTLPAFEYALKAGVDVLEFDLVVTKDDQLVVSHDAHINPVICVGPKGQPVAKDTPIRQLTLAQVRKYDCGSKQNPRFPDQVLVPGTRIPTLEEVLKNVKASKHPAAKTVHFNIETKIEPARPDLYPSPKRFAELVVQALNRAAVVPRTILQSFDARTLIAAKARDPKLRTSMLISDNAPPMVPIAKALKAEFISPHHLWITAEEVSKLHAAGVQVVPWTANSPEAWQRLVKLGVDGIITDYPGRLTAWMKKRGLR
jgi:glycerophosphoryl diester phosphodiesterase